MRDRVILAVRFTPASSGAEVRKAVGGFLRYVQHRDLHPTQPEGKPRQEMSGLLKYVAYRDRASTRAELFGPAGTLTSADRKGFAAFVANALDTSNPQLFRGRDGALQERRRAVYRMVISPERAVGLDLRRLTSAAVGRLEQESGMTDLRWIAAIHRNTAHHHVHLVLAGMHPDNSGVYHRVDLTKPQLAAMKEALTLEIEHQRAERTPGRAVLPAAIATKASAAGGTAPIRDLSEAARPATTSRGRWNRTFTRHGSVIALRAVARRYQRRMQRELEERDCLAGLELAA